MSVPYTILLSWPSLCQKVSKLVEIWRSSDENNFDCFFETRCKDTIMLMTREQKNLNRKLPKVNLHKTLACMACFLAKVYLVHVSCTEHLIESCSIFFYDVCASRKVTASVSARHRQHIYKHRRQRLRACVSPISEHFEQHFCKTWIVNICGYGWWFTSTKTNVCIKINLLSIFFNWHLVLSYRWFWQIVNELPTFIPFAQRAISPV